MRREREVIYQAEMVHYILLSLILTFSAQYLLCKYIHTKTDTSSATILFSGEGADEVMQGYRHFKNAPSANDADVESRRLISDVHYFDILRADTMAAAWG